MKKKVMIVLLILVLLAVSLCVLASHPVVSCKTDLPEGYLDAVKSQSAGVYSSRLPLVPVYVSVDSLADRTVFYTVYYFPLGTVGMSYGETDGYNIEKPLFPGA